MTVNIISGGMIEAVQRFDRHHHFIFVYPWAQVTLMIYGLWCVDMCRGSRGIKDLLDSCQGSAYANIAAGLDA